MYFDPLRKGNVGRRRILFQMLSEGLMENKWIPKDIPILMDEYGDNFPTGTIMSLDLETNEKDINDEGFRIVCVGLSDGIHCWVYFDLRFSLFYYLSKIKWIVHDGIHAELPWLNKTGRFKYSQDNIYYDTKIGAYNYDSTKKNYALKPLVEDYLTVSYPTYSEIVSCPDYIKSACERQTSLYKQNKKGPSLPKKLTLDVIDREIVAQYNSADTYWTFKLYEWLKKNETTGQKQFLENIELPTNKLISHMEQKGIKIDTDEIRRIHNATSKARRKEKKSLFEIAGKQFNPNSPKQVMELLKLRGIDSKTTGEDDLIRFKDDAFVRTLLEYRGLQKLCSTYTIPLYFNAIKTEDHRIHTRFGQNTLTGRLSSSDPINLQNQPPEVRSGFVAEDGNSFCDGDWSNVELYLPAHFSGEPAWIDVLSKPDGDLHMVTASRLFGEGVYSLPEKERKENRKIAKETLLTITNSGTYRSLSKTLGCSDNDARGFEEGTKRLYPRFIQWLKETKRKAREQKGISTYFGRWVRFPSITSWCGRANCEEICAKTRQFCKSCFIRQETEKQAISVKVQGSASDLCKMAALRLYKEYGYVPVAMIHDQIVLEEPTERAEEVREQLKYVMENVWLFTPRLKAEVKIAKDLLQSH